MDFEESFDVVVAPDDPLAPEEELDDDALLSELDDLLSELVEDFSPDSLLCAFFRASDG